MSRVPVVLAFDVFGTVVDWRSSIARESEPFLAKIGLSSLNPSAFADAWRGQYLQAMIAFKKSGRPFEPLDVLHREMLESLLRSMGVKAAALDDHMMAEWNKAWHRLDPWPDSVEGLARLKTKFPIVTLSNGNVALMLDLARRSSLPWDAILGAEFTRAYKPDPQAYIDTVEALAIEPEQLCLVAAHHSDLAAARSCGLTTAYIDRPLEYGGIEAPDAGAIQDWEWSASSITELAEQLGC